MKYFKDFIIINGKLYFFFLGSGGVLARALTLTKAREELQHIHGLSCGDKDMSFIGVCRGRDII